MSEGDSEVNKIIVAGSPEAALGFRLAGLVESCMEPDKVEALLAREDVSMIIITDTMKNALPERVKKLVDMSTKPLCIEVADYKTSGGAARGEGLRDRIKRAIGLDIGGSKK